MKLIVITTILAILALGISVYDLLTMIPGSPLVINSGIPSFNVLDFSFNVLPYRTQFTVQNNGTAVAHNVRVDIRYGQQGVNQILTTEYIPELETGKSETIFTPIGSYDLRMSGNSPICPVEIEVACKEGCGYTFRFNTTVP